MMLATRGPHGMCIQHIASVESVPVARVQELLFPESGANPRIAAQQYLYTCIGAQTL